MGGGSGSGTAGGVQGGQGNGSNGSSRESVQALADAVELLGSQVGRFLESVDGFVPCAVRCAACAPALQRALLLRCFSSASRVHARPDGARSLPLRAQVAVKVAREGSLLVFPTEPPAVSLVAQRCLEFEPHRRPTFQDIVADLQVLARISHGRGGMRMV